MSAIRLARGYTGRDLILKFEGCYHGHSDYLLVKAGSGLATFGRPSSSGVPASCANQTAILPLDVDEAVEQFFTTNGDKLAAVIIEGIPANNGLLVQRPEYMKLLRRLSENHGTLFILDEVITGFRLGLGGAADYYGVVPDLVTYGKVIGGGLPVGAFGGRAEIMDQLSPVGPVYQAGTLSGNPIAMAAGWHTLQRLVDGTEYASLEHKSASFAEHLRKQISSLGAQIVRVGSIFWLVFQEELPRRADQISGDGIARFNAIHGMALDRGIYLPPSGYEVCFVSTAHTESALDEAADTLTELIRIQAD
jgi:glutamate-1-semialdehyde 2,1-aminomutase